MFIIVDQNQTPINHSENDPYIQMKYYLLFYKNEYIDLISNKIINWESNFNLVRWCHTPRHTCS